MENFPYNFQGGTKIFICGLKFLDRPYGKSDDKGSYGKSLGGGVYCSDYAHIPGNHFCHFPTVMVKNPEFLEKNSGDRLKLKSQMDKMLLVSKYKVRSVQIE